VVGFFGADHAGRARIAHVVERQAAFAGFGRPRQQQVAVEHHRDVVMVHDVAGPAFEIGAVLEQLLVGERLVRAARPVVYPGRDVRCAAVVAPATGVRDPGGPAHATGPAAAGPNAARAAAGSGG